MQNTVIIVNHFIAGTHGENDNEFESLIVAERPDTAEPDNVDRRSRVREVLAEKICLSQNC